ncbi:MAG TPA: PKD domain-containing protein, partial [Acidimicrobiales bacterium]
MTGTRGGLGRALLAAAVVLGSLVSVDRAHAVPASVASAPPIALRQGVVPVAPAASTTVADSVDCTTESPVTTACDYYYTDGNGDKHLGGSNSATPTTITSKPATFTETAVNHIVPDVNNQGMGQVSMQTPGGAITSYSPHDGPDVSVTIINNNIIRWNTTGNAFGDGAAFTVSSLEHATGTGSESLGAGWGSIYGSGVSYGPPITLAGADGPDAEFTINPNGKVPGQFQFVSDSSDPDNEALTQRWTLGDGGTATGPAVTHTYTHPGTYSITLTVTNTDGKKSSITKTVTVAATALEVSVTTPSAPGVAVGSTITAHVHVSADSAGLGNLTGLTFDGGTILSANPAVSVDLSGAPKAPAAFTLAPGQAKDYDVPVVLKATGKVVLTSAVSGFDVTSAAVHDSGSVTVAASGLQVVMTANPATAVQSD